MCSVHSLFPSFQPSMVLIVKIPADSSLPLTEESVAISTGDAIPCYLESSINNDAVIDTSVLIRRSEDSAGLYAYCISSTSLSIQNFPNIRATTLAMACGLHSKRFVNDVYLGRLGYTSSGLANVDVSIDDIQAAVLTPDLRDGFIREINQSLVDGNIIKTPPDWLCSGAQKNYHDNKSMAALAAAMTRAEEEDGCSGSSSTSTSESEDGNAKQSVLNRNVQAMKHEVTLCLHCRRPASTLCIECNGAYFCNDSRRCKEIG